MRNYVAIFVLFLSTLCLSAVHPESVIGSEADIQRLINRARPGDTVVLSPVVYIAQSTIQVKKPITIIGNGAKISFRFPVSAGSASGRLFDVTSSDVTFDGVWFDAAGVTATLSGGNRYAIFAAGSSATHIQRIAIRNCHFTNLTSFYGPQPATINVMHAVFLQFVDDAVVDGNVFDAISGSAMFVANANQATLIHNQISQTGWGSIYLYADVHYADVGFNTITGNGPNTRYWGGSIDSLSQHSYGDPPNSNVRIHDNYISGKHMYGAVIRTGSNKYLEIDHNVAEEITGTLTPTSMVFVGARGGEGVDMSERGIQFVNIHSNRFIAGGTDLVGVYVLNQLPPGAIPDLPPAQSITIYQNQFLGLDAVNYFTNCVILHGRDRGLRDSTIAQNTCQARPTPQTVLPGAVVVVADGPASPAVIADVAITGNNIKWFTAPGTTEPAPPGSIGILVGQFSQRTRASGNFLGDFFQNVWVDPQSCGAISQTDNSFSGAVSSDIAWNGAPMSCLQ